MRRRERRVVRFWMPPCLCPLTRGQFATRKAAYRGCCRCFAKGPPLCACRAEGPTQWEARRVEKGD